MTLWGQAKRLNRNPFARIVTRLSEAEDPESFERDEQRPETFSEWFLRSLEDAPPLFEGNPYVDRIENDPILVICAGMTDDEPPPPPKVRRKPMGWEEYRKRQSELRRKKRNQTSEGDPMVDVETELKAVREQLREALLVPKGDFPLLPALEELIRERNEARAERAENELEIVKLQKELSKSKSREAFLSMCMKAGDTPPCRNCGRIMLAGRCCEKPDIPEGQPVGVPLEEYDKAVGQLESLKDLVSEYVVGKDDQSWVREMLTKGFVPSISGTKARRERDEAQGEAQQWHDLVSRLRTHLNIPHDATHQDAPRLAREALHKEQVRGAGWMREALGSQCSPEEVCEARRPKEDPPLVNEYRKETPKCPPHRFALRQTTGKETCIDCFVEENPGSPGLGVEQFAKNRADRRKSARAKKRGKV